MPCRCLVGVCLLRSALDPRLGATRHSLLSYDSTLLEDGALLTGFVNSPAGLPGTTREEFPTVSAVYQRRTVAFILHLERMRQGCRIFYTKKPGGACIAVIGARCIQDEYLDPGHITAAQLIGNMAFTGAGGVGNEDVMEGSLMEGSLMEGSFEGWEEAVWTVPENKHGS